MPKELFISSSPHETKVAVLEDEGLVEVFYQRDTDVGLVGGIYKGRVSRVLPGMQSAFVDVGLERDAFLYVSDFFEDSDEYDRVVAEAETRVSKYTTPEARAASAPDIATAATSDEATGSPAADGEMAEQPAMAMPTIVETGPAPAPAPAAPLPVSSESQPQSPAPDRPWNERGGRRRRRGRGFEKPQFRDRQQTPSRQEAPSASFQVLPGESLARYGPASAESSPATPFAGAPSVREPEQRSEELNATSVIGAEDAVEGEAADVQGGFPAQATDSPVEMTVEFPESVEPEAAAERFEEDLLAGNLRVAPLSVEPDAPTRHHAAVTNVGEAEDLAGVAVSEPAPEPAFTEVLETGATDEEVSGEAQEMAAEEASEAMEPGDEDDQIGTAPDEALQEMPEDADEPARQAEGDESATVPAGGAAELAGDRSYTMRDQQQRPRFAPRRGRRGRGRFGNRSPRPEGSPRPQFPRAGNNQPVQINEVLKEGQEILVQIAKEPLGTKGARITSHIALPGRYLVYMPTIHHIGVSRKIGTEEERLRLRNIIVEHRGSLTGGIIVRTAAAGRSEEELKADINFLARLWSEIRNRTERSKAPALIHRDLTLVERILRDILSPEFRSVRADNEIEYQNVLDFVHRFQPSLVGHVKLYTKETPMFEEFGVQAEIDKALKPKVWLKSGGYIVINQTEALVAIDVNTGKYVGKTNRLEDTIVKTNIDAVKEIVRQVRLRDLGGIIVIDFIDMDDRRNRMKVVQALEEALRHDRAPTKILSFNEFGLVALTRKRVKQSLERTLSEQCPYCTGSGWIKSVTTVCYEIMEEAKKMAGEIEGNALTLRVHPEVARALKSREGVLTAELESLTGKDVVIKSDPAVHQERFEIF